MEFNEGNAIVFHGSKLPLEKKEFTFTGWGDERKNKPD